VTVNTWQVGKCSCILVIEFDVEDALWAVAKPEAFGDFSSTFD
jgi:hypothetical protein